MGRKSLSAGIGITFSSSARTGTVPQWGPPYIWDQHKLTSVKNPQANAVLERVPQMIMGMLHTTEIDLAKTISKSDIIDFLTNAAWAV
jgi:hypothetical protein